MRKLILLLLILSTGCGGIKKSSSSESRKEEDKVLVQNRTISKVTRVVDTTVSVLLPPMRGVVEGVECRDTSGVVNVDSIGKFYFDIRNNNIDWRFDLSPQQARVKINETTETLNEDTREESTSNEVTENKEDKEVQIGVVGWRLVLIAFILGFIARVLVNRFLPFKL